MIQMWSNSWIYTNIRETCGLQVLHPNDILSQEMDFAQVCILSNSSIFSWVLSHHDLNTQDFSKFGRCRNTKEPKVPNWTSYFQVWVYCMVNLYMNFCPLACFCSNEMVLAYWQHVVACFWWFWNKDMKLNNLFLGSDGQLKIVDFGLAWIFERALSFIASSLEKWLIDHKTCRIYFYC